MAVRLPQKGIQPQMRMCGGTCIGSINWAILCSSEVTWLDFPSLESMPLRPLRAQRLRRCTAEDCWSQDNDAVTGRSAMHAYFQTGGRELLC